MESNLSNIERAKIFFTEILEKGDLSWIDKLFSDLFGLRPEEVHNTDVEKLYGTGKIGMKLYLNTQIQAFEDAKYTLLNILDCNNQIIIRWRMKAKHTGEIFSLKASNKNVDLIGVSWFFFDDQHLIRNLHLVWNGFSLIDQINFEIKPKEEISS